MSQVFSKDVITHQPSNTEVIDDPELTAIVRVKLGSNAPDVDLDRIYANSVSEQASNKHSSHRGMTAI